MIIYKTDQEIDLMRESGRLAAKVLDMIESHIRPGVSTLELNDICHDYIIQHDAIPAPLNYRGFPKSICTSINEVVCHGIPSKRQVLKEGDIINVDITTILHGFHGDTSRTFRVGQVSDEANRIVATCKEALDRAIDFVRVGVRLGDLGSFIQEFVEKKGYSVVRDFVGHGIGRKFHEDPQVKHYGDKGTGAILKPGMTFTIEPMINQGAWGTRVLQDKWTAVTVDGKLSAQFEHTIAIRSDGSVEILTQSDG